MKTNLIKTALVAAVAAVSMSAQAVEMKVPFDFVVGDTVLQAGTYSVQLSNPARVLVIKSADRAGAIAFPIALAPPTGANQNIVTFKGYGDEYFLTEVSTGHLGRLGLAKTARERRLAAAPSTPRKTVVLAVHTKASH